MITFEEVLKNKNNMKWIDMICYRNYNSINSYTIRANMDYEDFKQEVLLYLCRSWHTYNDKYKVNTFTKYCIDTKTKLLIRDYNRRVRKVHNLEGGMIVELDNPDSTENKSLCYENSFDYQEAVETILANIPPRDRDICRMYLEGASINSLQNFTDYSRKVLYKKMNKYKKIFEQGYQEYKSMCV